MGFVLALFEQTNNGHDACKFYIQHGFLHPASCAKFYVYDPLKLTPAFYLSGFGTANGQLCLVLFHALWRTHNHIRFPLDQTPFSLLWATKKGKHSEHGTMFALNCCPRY
jgi:hypothetical protein